MSVSIRKQGKLFYYESDWHRLLREVVESPSLETFKSCPDMVLGKLL